MFDILVYIILAFCVVGAIIGWHNHKKNVNWGQPLMVSCAIVAILFGTFESYVKAVGFGSASSAHERTLKYQMSKGTVLGRYMKAKYRGAKILIIKDPTSTQDDMNAFRREIYGEIEVVDVVSPIPVEVADKPVNASQDIPLYESSEVWYTTEIFEQLVQGYQYDILVTGLGLPSDVTIVGKEFSCSCLRNKLVVFLSGNIVDYIKGFFYRRIGAAVTGNPLAAYDAKSVPKDPQQAFDKRYLLVTPENYFDLKEKYGIFDR